ncbi:MAG: plasma-membrane proton-efflux P-type ATPase [Archaeoglobaceae archaeon]
MSAASSKETAHFESVTAGEAVDELSTDKDKGLSGDEVERRIERYGSNRIEEERTHPVLKLFSHFWGPIPWMIEIALILTAVVQHWEDFTVIFTLLLINGAVGFWHESKADKAIQALKEKMALKARVIRNGKHKVIAAEELVPGDIILLRIGDVVPADSKVLEDNINVDESSLTGESFPVEKEKDGTVYSGTVVKQGETKLVVVATGDDTKFARTVELVATAKKESHFQGAVLRIGYFLMAGAGIILAIVISAAVLRGDPFVQVLLFALVLVVAAIPAALPAVLSVTMSVGANRLAEMKAIVSYLPAMEEMAGLEVLCADKTGTLTKNELELQDPVILSAEDMEDLIISAALTARDTEDPIDRAVLEALEDKEELESYEIAEFRAFDPSRKMADADVRRDGSEFTVAKGASQVILDLVSPDERTREEINKKVEELGQQGFRSLGVARKKDGEWKYLGILPLLDPPRADTAEAIKSSKEHNIQIKMVTGDHVAIAKQVAKQIGMGQNIIEAKEAVQEGGESDVLRVDGFAQVTPEDKFNIIKQLQANDMIVGMTGDGVNDAPALKQADVGVAVHSATDAARSAAELILTAPGLKVITQGVEEARRIFERMTSYATYRITETIRLLLFISLSILIFNFYPVTTIMIVLLAILNDIPIMAIAFDNVPTPDHPVRWEMRRVLSLALVLGIAGVFSSFLLFFYVEQVLQFPAEMVQTFMFLKLLVAGHMTIFLTRNRGALWQKPYPSLILFGALEATQIAGTLIAVYGFLVYPIGWGYALMIWGYALVWLFVLNGIKIASFRS